MRIQKLNIINKIAPKKRRGGCVCGGWVGGGPPDSTYKYHAYDCYSEGDEAQTRSIASCKLIFQLDAPAREDAPPCRVWLQNTEQLRCCCLDKTLTRWTQWFQYTPSLHFVTRGCNWLLGLCCLATGANELGKVAGSCSHLSVRVGGRRGTAKKRRKKGRYTT